MQIDLQLWLLEFGELLFLEFGELLFQCPISLKGMKTVFFSSPKTERYGFLNKLLQVSESLAAASTRPMCHRLFLALLGLLKALFDPF